MTEDLGFKLTAKEIKVLKKRLRREPNILETGIVDAEWSEHCSYKSSKSILKQLPTEGKNVVLGPGFDAGVINVGDNHIVSFHIESHNHPSAIDPYGGAATGIGGVIRDILAIGTRPIALLNSLHFGNIEESINSRWLLKNVVKGIADYGNCVGIPTVAGEVSFDKSFEKNCLVDVICIGAGKIEDLVLAEAKYPNDLVVLLGGLTGRDGIHGVTFASNTLDNDSENYRSAVQIPNPFMKKLIMEATLEAIKTGYVTGLKDLGGGGLACGISETANKGDRGMEINLDQIPLREINMTSVETMISESQERMLFIIKKGFENNIYKIFEKYELPYSCIGSVKDHNNLIIKQGNFVIANLPVKDIVNAPLMNRLSTKPVYINKLKKIKLPKEPKNLSKIILKLISSPNISSKEWIYRQYDHEVGIRTVIKPGESGATVLRLDNGKFLSVKVDGNSKHCYLDPYNGAAGGLSEVCRNVISTGAEPMAMVNHCQFGDPGNPNVFWTFKESVRGMADYCRILDLPCVGGKVSFYNEDSSTGNAIKPSPVVSVIGLINNEKNIKKIKVTNSDDLILLIGSTFPEMGGSEYYEYIFNILGGTVPKVNFKYEYKFQRIMLKLINDDLINSIIDCSEGGLITALSELCILSDKGIEINYENISTYCKRIDETLFSESHGRMIITTDKDKAVKIEKLVKMNRLNCNVVGKISGNNLIVKNSKKDLVNLELSQLKKSWNNTIPNIMDRSK